MRGGSFVSTPRLFFFSTIYGNFFLTRVVLLETRIKPTFNRLIPTIFSSPLKITSAKIQILYTVFLATFNENNLSPFF